MNFSQLDNLTTCGILTEDGADCFGQIDEGAPFNICSQHAQLVYEWVYEVTPLRVKQEDLGMCTLCGKREVIQGAVGWTCLLCGLESSDYKPAIKRTEVIRPSVSAVPIAGIYQPKYAEVVYYLEFGSRIKIGTSRNLRKRLLALPYDRVLTIELGGRNKEQARHTQFSDARVTGEWFDRDEQLLTHIAALQESNGKGWSTQLSEWETNAQARR